MILNILHLWWGVFALYFLNLKCAFYHTSDASYLCFSLQRKEKKNEMSKLWWWWTKKYIQLRCNLGSINQHADMNLDSSIFSHIYQAGCYISRIILRVLTTELHDHLTRVMQLNYFYSNDLIYQFYSHAKCFCKSSKYCFCTWSHTYLSLVLLDDSEYSVLQQVSLYACWLRLSCLKKNQL